MGRLSLGDFIRKFDFVNAKEDGDGEEESIHNQLVDFERMCKHDVTVEELKDVYAAFQEKVCVPNFGYRHSGAYWAAFSTANILNDLKSRIDDESEATHLAYGKLDVHTWLCMLRSGPTSAHAELMTNFRGYDFEKYLQTCQKEELAQIFEMMKIQFSFDTNDTDMDEQTYASTMSREVKAIFGHLGGEKLRLAHEAFLDLYLHYWKQLPYLAEKLTTNVGYIVRDMSIPFERKRENGRKVRNPYLDLKKAEVLKSHLEAMKEMLMEFEGDIKKQRFESILIDIINAAMEDGIIEPLFDSLMDLCVRFVQRETLPKNGGLILSVVRIKMFRYLKDYSIKPSPAMLDTSLKALTELVAAIKNNMDGEMLGLVDEVLNECILPATKMPAELVKLLLALVNMLLASGHQKLIELATDIVNNENLQKVFIWRKYLGEVKLFLKTVSKQPLDKLYPESDSDDKEVVMDNYNNFMEPLLKQLEKDGHLPKLSQELLTYIFDCLETGSPVKGELANNATEFIIITTDTPEFTECVLARCDGILKKKDLTWNDDMSDAIKKMLESIIKMYDGDGRLVTARQHELFMSVFMTSLAGNDIDETFYPPEQERYGGVKFLIFNGPLRYYISLHVETLTQNRCVGVLPDILKWSMKAEEEDRDDVKDPALSALNLFSNKPPKEMAKSLPQIMAMFMNPKNMKDLLRLVTNLYQYNPRPVHDRLSELIGMYDSLKERDKDPVIQILSMVAGEHPEAINNEHMNFLFKRCQEVTWDMQIVFLHILYSISRRNPEKLQAFFPKLLDSTIFNEKTLSLRILVILCATGRNEKYSHQAIDFFMKLATNKNSEIANRGLSQLPYMMKDHKDYMQKYKATIQKIESTTNIPEIRQTCESIIQVLEGKNFGDVYRDLYEELQSQKDFTASLDKKLDHTMDTVITMGDHVTEHHKELIHVRRNLEDLEEKVEEINEDLGETKIKVEEIDNKTMTNAPKWSRDLTKLMNPDHEADWRLLASRLGYCNDDIRAWSQQHDPCMALLSEWYATHKTSEANHAVLTALTEMNRMDGAAIVENAMKASEGVVEDEEFEYPSPPPIFLSYQWGMQDEVKLLKQHLNMAGYECWMDIGQMGGGDKLFAKIDNGIRAAKVIVCCVTEKYAQSPNCNREVNLSVNLGKPIIPLLMEKMGWPPKGSMGPIFSEYLFIRFFQRGGEETADNRYWPVPKFQELLMQLNYSVAPDESIIQKEYNKWWASIVEDIVIDKTKGQSASQSSSGQASSGQDDTDQSPLVFLSYQWGKQPQVKALYQRIRSLGYTVWMDIFQMGGGDSLYDKIDRGVRGCKVVVSCVTPKYALSANCRREVSLADALKKPIIPLLLEQMKWPPDGPMSMVFTELLFINVYRDPDIQTKWTGEKFDELSMKIQQHIGDVPEAVEDTTSQGKPAIAAPKHEPDGSSSKNKFVEPKSKTPEQRRQKPAQTPKKETTDKAPVEEHAPVVENKAPRQNSSTQRNQKPTPTPKKENAANAPMQKKAAPRTSADSGKTDAKPTRKASTDASVNTPTGRDTSSVKTPRKASNAADNAQHNAVHQNSSSASTNASKTYTSARKSNSSNEPAMQSTQQKPAGSHSDQKQGRSTSNSHKDDAQRAAKSAADNKPKPTPTSEKPQSSSCAIL